MNNPTLNKNVDQSKSRIAIFLYKVPNENHDALVRINKHSHDFFMKHGVLKFEVFNLTTRENVMDFVNLAKTFSAGYNEEVWLEIRSYRDAEHVQEFIKSMESDKSGDRMYKEFMKLITPGSVVSFGNFSKLEEIS